MDVEGSGVVGWLGEEGECSVNIGCGLSSWGDWQGCCAGSSVDLACGVEVVWSSVDCNSSVALRVLLVRLT